MEILNTDIFARYVIEKAYFRISNKTVRHNAFMPAPRDNQCSVFNTRGISEKKIWKLGEKYVAQPKNKPLLARADIEVSEIHNHSLVVTPDPTIHSRHANISSYPDDRSKCKLVAIKLAQSAKLILIN